MTQTTRDQVVPLVSVEFATWLVTRMWAILCGSGVVPYPQAGALFNDVRLYDWWAGNILAGHFPINDPMWQYPPLAALLFTAGYVLAHGTSGFIALAFVADSAVMAMLSRAGIRHGTSVPARIWAVAPVLMGPIVLGRFDVFPTAAAVAALLALTPTARGSWLAVGAMLKVWPALGLLAVPRRALPRTVAGFAVTTAALAATLLAWWPDAFSFLTEQRARGLQAESVGALPYMVWGAGPGTVSVEYRYGALEVAAAHTGVMSLLLTATMVVALGLIVVWRAQGRLEEVPAADLTLMVVLTAMTTSRVLSPQYMLWALGLLAVAAVRPSPHLRTTGVLLAVSALCGQAIYPWLYAPYLLGGGMATAVQCVRIITLLCATAVCWRATIRSLTPAAPIRPTSR